MDGYTRHGTNEWESLCRAKRVTSREQCICVFKGITRTTLNPEFIAERGGNRFSHLAFLFQFQDPPASEAWTIIPRDFFCLCGSSVKPFPVLSMCKPFSNSSKGNEGRATDTVLFNHISDLQVSFIFFFLQEIVQFEYWYFSHSYILLNFNEKILQRLNLCLNVLGVTGKGFWWHTLILHNIVNSKALEY